MSRLLASILFLYFSTANASSDLVKFTFGQGDPGGAVICDGTNKGDIPPIECSFASGLTEMVISRANWKGDAILIKDDDTVKGLCSGSVRKHDNVTPSTYSLDPTCIVIGGVKFFFKDEGVDLTCNGQVKPHDPNGINCLYDEFDRLLISRVGWKGDALLIKGESITGQCAGAFKQNETQSDWYDVDLSCTARYVRPVELSTTPLVDEWYTDLPWHQKLSTKDSNLIDTPFVLPYVALLPGLCKIKNNKNEIHEPRCMLRYGVLNIMAMHRKDRLYGKGEAPTDKDCVDCVQVKIRIQRLNTLIDNGDGFQADVMRNLFYDNEETDTTIPSLAYVINEATVFAPWRPWYTGHYCAQKEDDVADSVCYEDYFTTQLIATSEGGWLWDAPAVFDPKNEDLKKNLIKYCASDNDYCDMYLGKIDWITKDPKITVRDCGSDPIAVCTEEVEAKTASLDSQFNTSIKSYVDDGRYPWPIVNSDIDLTKDIDTNPFIGFYELERFKKAFIDEDGILKGSLFRGTHYVLPKKCTKEIYLGARQGNQEDIERLADCVLNFEIHTNGYYRQWRYLYGETDPVKNSLSDEQIIAAVEDITKALPGINANQYGRTLFLYAGVPEQHLPVSFKIIKGDEYTPDMSLYDKVYNASIYTQYLPMVNVADQTLFSKSYANDFWHAVLMSNHMNQTPDHFIRGIRGRTLWHNEYRSNILYNSAEHVGVDGKLPIAGTAFENALGHVDFPAGFQVAKATAPFHGNTCDACHIRNGSGVPLMPNGKLPQIHVDRGMKKGGEFEITKDYTYSNKELPSMKMVLFDLGDKREDGFYNNKIMNFYGDSFHVNQKNKLPTYSMQYVNIKEGDGYELVVDVHRDKDHKINRGYVPQRVEITDIDIGNNIVCKDDNGFVARPDGVLPVNWPNTCVDVAGSAISTAINDANASIGFMHLLGRRLGNTPMIEMVPDQEILDIQAAQKKSMRFSGTYELVSGTRGGGKANFRDCSLVDVEKETQSKDCYLSRWGWIGDRASLEDQIANAANVEMNMTSTDSYHELHSSPPDKPKHLVRYNKNVCGPADAHCKNQYANSDITEQEIKDMATYQRWIGIPNRSEYQVSSSDVQKGEALFRDRLECNSCHVIDKIAFVKNDNMLPDEERDHLENLKIRSGNKPEYPFISYLGTDLLMHDMGYLSQVAGAPLGKTIRSVDDGTVKNKYKSYVQTIRTPALKGLRFNRFVTDSNHNTTVPLDTIKPFNNPKSIEIVSGCDFLLHDGRACDAIEAAFLHDGPAIKELNTIENLNGLDGPELDQLRAFLYSL